MIFTAISEKGKALASPAGAVLALGCFDGFHQGHRTLISLAREKATEQALPLGIWSPLGVQKPGGRLFSRAEFLGAAAALQVDLLIEEPFNAIKDLSGETFFNEYILKIYRPAALVCGENFRFGAGARMTAADLAAMCASADIPLHLCPSVKDEDGETVSSTAVKSALILGDIQKATLLLGAPYSLTAVVSKGRQVGRNLGFPTLNLPLPDGCPLKFGVYFATVTMPEGDFPAAVNVGVHPTFGKGGTPVCEAHLLKMPARTIEYGEECTVAFLHFRRAEQTFSSPEDLKKTVFQDLDAARTFFNCR